MPACYANAMRALMMISFLFATPALSAEGSEDDEHSAEPPGDEGEATELPEFAGADRPLFEEANRELSLMRSSTYVHKTSVDEASGRFDFDCSGFISYALAHSSRAAYRELRGFAHHRPLAKDFVAVASNPGGAPGRSRSSTRPRSCSCG